MSETYWTAAGRLDAVQVVIVDDSEYPPLVRLAGEDTGYRWPTDDLHNTRIEALIVNGLA